MQINKLDKMEARFISLEDQLSDPSVIADQNKWRELSKEHSELAEVVSKYREYKEVLDQAKEALEILGDKSQSDLHELAKEELKESEKRRDELDLEIHKLLIPKDPNDDHNCIIEIRGAAGGDEGNIFAGDLYRMYARYAEIMGWKVEIMEAIEAMAGGYTLISFFVKGNEAYKHLKFESGSHRVQRVPKTETQGRIHTSTATVLAMPDIEEEEIDINPADLVIETHRSSGAGGQHVNKTDSAVRITHTPTGISVNCQDGRSQHDNKATALRLIRARVFEEMQERAEAEKGAVRRDKIGSGDRSEKIRTYNYPQNRVTDHRIGLTLQQLDRIVEGKLNDVIDALLVEEQRQKLAGNL